MSTGEPPEVAQFPEHEKLAKIRDKSQAIHDFLDWAGEQGLHLAEWQERVDYMLPTFRKDDDLLAEHFGIDLNKLEAEKLEMLDLLRTAK